MRLVPIGCSGSYPGPGSPASCYLVQAEHDGRTWTIALDLGNGSLGPMHQIIDPRDLDAVLLTHLHPDHCLDITGLYVMRTYQPGGPREGLLPVWAPAGAPERLGRAYGVDAPESLDDRFDFHVLREGEPVTIGPFTVTPHPMNHPVEAYGLRVEATRADGGMARLAYTGDTDDCPQLRALFADCDLVLADCAFVDGRDDHLRGVHMTGSRAARAAVEAGGVGRLLLTHIPSWNDPTVCQAQASTVWPGQVELARPLTPYEI